MAKMNSLLAQRLKSAGEKFTKMTHLVELSSQGNLSSFSGVFRVAPLTQNEQSTLQEILTEYSNEKQEIGADLSNLSALTAEVKAINNQAIILHGERIKKGQTLLKKYRNGAFTAWLIATYGNRQTPYNFLQYYEFYSALPEKLHPQLDLMPRQAIYSLASRSGPIEEKLSIVQNYKGEAKQELLSLIRKTFPLSQADGRASDSADLAIQTLRRLVSDLSASPLTPSKEQKGQLKALVKEIHRIVHDN